MLAYFIFFPLNLLPNYLIIILVSVNLLYLISKCLPYVDVDVIFSTLILPNISLLLFLEGFITNVFKTSIDNFKTLLINTGGSPKLVFK